MTIVLLELTFELKGYFQKQNGKKLMLSSNKLEEKDKNANLF